jgi:hypothetical protein
MKKRIALISLFIISFLITTMIFLSSKLSKLSELDLFDIEDEDF